MKFMTTEYLKNYPNIDISGNRYQYNGINIPRVTEILSDMWHDDYLLKWANYLGFNHKKYNDELQKAANIGTMAHDSIEFYIQNGEDPVISIPESKNAYDGYIKWYKMLLDNGHTVEVIGMEQKLTCQWFGGTYDLLLKIDGKICLVDFKTSNHISIKYYMQIAAYKYMLELLGYKIDYSIILQLDKKKPDYYEYFIEFSNNTHQLFMNYALQTFFSLVSAYYNRKHLENIFGMVD